MKVSYVSIAMAAALSIQAQQPVDSGAVIRTETRVVLVDAVVTNRKGYVHDLTARNFKIYEDNKEQTITSFASGADPASPRNTEPQYIVLFFDDSAMSLREQLVARQAAVQFIDGAAGPRRLMAVVNFGGAFEIAQNFTPDAGRLKAAVTALKAPATRVAENSLARRDSILALRDFAKSLAGVRGRKTLIFLTPGFAVNAQVTMDLNAAVDEFNRSDVAIYPIDVRGALPTTAGSDIAGPRPVVGRPPVESPSNDSLSNRDLMQALAGGTGGFVIADTNDFTGAMKKIADELDEYYLLGYTPPESNEGSCHALKVKVDKGSVRARRSYCVASGNVLPAPGATEKMLETRAASGQTANVAATIEMPFFYTGANIARVHLAMEIAPESFQFEKQNDKMHAALDVLGIASKPDGSVAARFSDTVNLDFESEAEVDAFRQKPYHYENQFDIAPGTYRMKVVFHSGGKAFGNVDQPLTVGAQDGQTFALSAIAFSTSYAKASPDRAELDAALAQPRAPLVFNGLRLSPSGTNRFKVPEKPLIYFEIYEPAILNKTPEKPVMVGLQIRLFNRDTAAQIADSGQFRVPMPGNPSSPAISWGAKIPIDQLTPGAYRVVVDAVDNAGGKSSRSAEFIIE